MGVFSKCLLIFEKGRKSGKNVAIFQNKWYPKWYPNLKKTMRVPKFGIDIRYNHGRKRWRIIIPATLSNDGKRHDLLYPTRAAAEADRRELLDRFSRGEFARDEVLTSAQLAEA